MAIIKIGELLKLRGLDINKRIKLVRHKDARQKQFINGVEVEGNPYDWYRNDKDKFIAYQSEQHRDVFKNVDYIVSFIGETALLPVLSVFTKLKVLTTNATLTNIAIK